MGVVNFREGISWQRASASQRLHREYSPSLGDVCNYWCSDVCLEGGIAIYFTIVKLHKSASIIYRTTCSATMYKSYAGHTGCS